MILITRRTDIEQLITFFILFLFFLSLLGESIGIMKILDELIHFRLCRIRFNTLFECLSVCMCHMCIKRGLKLISWNKYRNTLFVLWIKKETHPALENDRFFTIRIYLNILKSESKILHIKLKKIKSKLIFKISHLLMFIVNKSIITEMT